MNKLISLSGLFILLGCVQDSPNIQQIENMQFFIDNKKNEEIIEIEPGLQYSVMVNKESISETPKLNQTITAHFHGTLTSGEIFWSSLDTEPLKIELSKLITGCQKAISLMSKGEKWIVYIDPSMAYGESARSGIPSNSILIFEIELIDFF